VGPTTDLAALENIQLSVLHLLEVELQLPGCLAVRLVTIATDSELLLWNVTARSKRKLKGKLTRS
jgi:hypothetical protein